MRLTCDDLTESGHFAAYKSRDTDTLTSERLGTRGFTSFMRLTLRIVAQLTSYVSVMDWLFCACETQSTVLYHNIARAIIVFKHVFNPVFTGTLR